MVLIFEPDFQPIPGLRYYDPLNVRTLFIVPYRLWSKVPPLHPPQPLEHPIKNIIISWTNTPTHSDEGDCAQAIWDLQDQYRSQGQDIPYNFVVCGDCNVYECRGWNAQPTPCDRHPDLTGKTIEVAHMAIKPLDGRRPHTGMALQAHLLGEEGIKKGYVREHPGFWPDYEMTYGSPLSKDHKEVEADPSQYTGDLQDQVDPAVKAEWEKMHSNMFDLM